MLKALCSKAFRLIALRCSYACTAPARKISSRSADELNAVAVANGFEPSYRPGTTVDLYETTQETVFVRVHGDENQRGGWVVPRSAIEGLSPVEIKQRLSLKDIPTQVSEVRIPAGSRVEVSQINPVGSFNGVDGGQIQYEIKMPGAVDPPDNWFTTLPDWQFGE